MKDYIIMTDSGCDLAKELVEKMNIEVVPMGLLIDDVNYKHYHDYRELSMEDFYAKIKAGHIGSTSCVNIMDAFFAMEKYVKEDIGVLYLSFSSGMSGSFNSSTVAAKKIREEYPGACVEVIDTLSGSVGLGMLAYLASKMKRNGHTMDDVAKFIRDNCLKTCHFFMVDDLKYIQRTGRISAIGAIVGTALGVRPVFKISDDGKVDLATKVRGRKSAIQYMVDQLKSSCNKPDLFFVCHADFEEGANLIVEKIKSEFPNAEINVGPVGPIIGNNTGPGSLAVIFSGDKR